MKSWGINRVVIVLAEPGGGKTTSMRQLAARYGDRITLCEASEVWADKPSALLSTMLRQLGRLNRQFRQLIAWTCCKGKVERNPVAVW